MSKQKTFSYEEMEKRTVDFYNSIGIVFSDEKIRFAIQSLTMPEYAHNYNQKKAKNLKIMNHRALATVGDAVCAAFLMIKKYEESYTAERMHKFKEALENKNLKIKTKNLFKDKLFAVNNDIKEFNKKDYATAFEAVIGFIGKYIGIEEAFNALERLLIW